MVYGKRGCVYRKGILIMEIIHAILNVRIPNGMTIKNWIENEERKIKSNKEEIEGFETAMLWCDDEYETEMERFRDVYAFMDYIKISKDALPFKLRSNIAEKSGYEQRIKDLQSKNENIQSVIDAYNLYLQQFANMQDKEKLYELRTLTKRYVSDYEFLIDMSLLNHKAFEVVKASGYSEDKFRAYSSLFDIFSIDNLKSLGHPQSDAALSNKTADLVLAICRLSWEIHYYQELRRFCELHRSDFGFFKKNPIKTETKFNSVITRWKVDSSFIDKWENKENAFFKDYRSQVSVEKEKEISLFFDDVLR